MADSCSSKATLECVIPILRVQDLHASTEFYVSRLGFTVDWQAPTMSSVSRDGFSIMLCEGEQGQPGTWVWIGVTDVEALHAECQRSGALIAQPPTRYPWAYEMRVEDPDGHVLRIGSDPIGDD